MLEIFDGFSARLASSRALKLHWESNIVEIKEYGESLLANQECDDQTVKTDKVGAEETCNMMKN